MAKHIIIHAGQHKTGSTSIQTYIDRNVGFFRDHGIAPVQDWTASLDGLSNENPKYNAKLIANAVVRESLATPLRIRGVCAALAPDARDQGIDRINAALKAEPLDTCLISAEAFSFLREPDEFARIERLCSGLPWRAVMFLRNKDSWLKSWEVQITHSKLVNQQGVLPGQGIADLSETSWLVDHDAIRRFWNGRCTLLSYEEAVARHGSVIPAFLEAIGLDPARCPAWVGVHMNSSEQKRQQLARGS